MLYYICWDCFAKPIEFLKFTDHITVRGALAFFTAFMMGILFGPIVIEKLKKMQFMDACDKSPCEDLRNNKKKKNTPTMGGVLIVFSFLFSIFLWARLDNHYVWWAILSTFGFALVGLLDDVIKAFSNKKGLTARGKFSLLLVVSVSLSIVLWKTIKDNPDLLYLYFPFLKALKINLAIGGGILFILFATLVIIGSSNAVNLTDGLDGLAIGCTIIVSTTLSIISYIVGRRDFSSYLEVTYIPGSGELSICCLALVGAGLAYLWFNGFPASVFMGDCGSLMLGGFLGYVAVALRQEILLGIIGGIFVLEAISVMIQVFWFKLTRRRVFRCAPIHHHFVLNGMEESKVVMRFWIIEIFLAIFALATLKLR